MIRDKEGTEIRPGDILEIDEESRWGQHHYCFAYEGYQGEVVIRCDVANNVGMFETSELTVIGNYLTRPDLFDFDDVEYDAGPEKWRALYDEYRRLHKENARLKEPLRKCIARR